MDVDAFETLLLQLTMLNSNVNCEKGIILRQRKPIFLTAKVF